MSVKVKGITKKAVTILLGASMLLLCACKNPHEEAVANEIAQNYNIPKEKQLIVYTSHKEEVYLPIIMEFENQTGIYVEIHAGGTTELFKDVREASKESACDIMFGGGIESFEAAKDLFIPYDAIDKDKLDSRYTSDRGFYTPFTELPIVFIYNNKLVRKEDAPASWEDLLSEKWKGQIAFANPHSSGTSYTILSSFSQIVGEDKLDDFINNLDNHVLSTSGEIIPSVSNGTFLVGITLEETAKKNILAGDDITMVYPSEGTVSLPDGVAMVKNAPHSYNAGKFIDFVTGFDTQKYAMSRFCRRPVRKDIMLSVGFDKIKEIDFDIEKAAKDEENVFLLWDSLIKEEE